MALDQSRLDILEKQLAAFPFSLLQDFLTFTKHCESHGIDVTEVEEFVRYHAGEGARERAREMRNVTRQLVEKSPKCKVCGMVMLLENVNERRSRMIDDHSKSWWICPDPLCEMEPILSDKYPYEIVADLGIQIHRVSNQPPKPPPAKRTRAAMAQRQSGKQRR